MAPLLRGKRALAPDLPLLERLAVLRGVPAGGVSVDSRLKKVPFQCSRAAFVALKDASFPQRAGFAFPLIRQINPMQTAGRALERVQP